MNGFITNLGLKIEHGYDLIRIYLGIGLFLKGIQFISDPHFLEMLWQDAQLRAIPIIAIHYVSISHLVGGILLAMGLLTRIAALAQIPILIGAVFFVHLSEGILSQEQNFEFAALVLFLLIVFFVFGSGSFSFDDILKKKKNT